MIMQCDLVVATEVQVKCTGIPIYFHAMARAEVKPGHFVDENRLELHRHCDQDHQRHDGHATMVRGFPAGGRNVVEYPYTFMACASKGQNWPLR